MKKICKKSGVLFALWLVAVLLCACYEDKGNYDYREIDEIKLSFPGNIGTEDNIKYVRKLGEMLSIHPEVTCLNKENLTYRWERYTDRTEVEILKNTQNLDLELEYGEGAALAWKSGGYSLRYTVKDTVSGQTTQKLIHLTVRSITPVGVYVLHGDASETDMGTIEDDNFVDGLTDGIVTPDYYSSRNEGQKLEGEGCGCCWFYGDGNPGMFVFTNRDGKYINTTSFHNDMDYEALFEGDVPTADLRRLTAESSGMVYVYADDNVYTIDVMYGIEEGSSFSPMFAGSEYAQVRPVPGYFFSDAGFMDGGVNLGPLAYSISRTAFVIYNWYAAPKPGDIWPLSSCGDDPNSGVFNPNDMSGQQLIGLDYGKSTNYGVSQHQWALLRKEKDNSIVVYHFDDEAYYEDKPTYDMASTLASDKLHPELLDLNCFQMSPLTEGIGFFSTPSGVYSLDMVNGMTDSANELFTPESSGECITKIKLLKFNDNSVVEGVNQVFKSMQGLCLYVATWDGTQGRIYSLYVDAEGGMDSERGEVKKYEGFKEIKDICFRLQ